MTNPYPQRKTSPRLHGYGYRADGGYFVTVCTHNWQHLFGHIIDGKMTLSPAGNVITTVWHAIVDESSFVGVVKLDAFVVMPNHIHGILWLQDSTVTLSRILQWYKSITTSRYSHGVKTENWPR